LRLFGTSITQNIWELSPAIDRLCLGILISPPTHLALSPGTSGMWRMCSSPHGKLTLEALTATNTATVPKEAAGRPANDSRPFH